MSRIAAVSPGTDVLPACQFLTRKTQSGQYSSQWHVDDASWAGSTYHICMSFCVAPEYSRAKETETLLEPATRDLAAANHSGNNRSNESNARRLMPRPLSGASQEFPCQRMSWRSDAPLPLGQTLGVGVEVESDPGLARSGRQVQGLRRSRAHHQASFANPLPLGRGSTLRITIRLWWQSICGLLTLAPVFRRFPAWCVGGSGWQHGLILKTQRTTDA